MLLVLLSIVCSRTLVERFPGINLKVSSQVSKASNLARVDNALLLLTADTSWT